MPSRALKTALGQKDASGKTEKSHQLQTFPEMPTPKLVHLFSLFLGIHVPRWLLAWIRVPPRDSWNGRLAAVLRTGPMGLDVCCPAPPLAWVLPDLQQMECDAWVLFGNQPGLVFIMEGEKGGGKRESQKHGSQRRACPWVKKGSWNVLPGESWNY